MNLAALGYMSCKERKELIVLPLQRMAPKDRLAWCRENEAALAYLSEGVLGRDLTHVGTLLCHASSLKMRREYPIIGDLKLTKQEEFEASVFGDEDKGAQGSYVTLKVVENDEEDEND